MKKTPESKQEINDPRITFHVIADGREMQKFTVPLKNDPGFEPDEEAEPRKRA